MLSQKTIYLSIYLSIDLSDLGVSAPEEAAVGHVVEVGQGVQRLHYLAVRHRT